MITYIKKGRRHVIAMNDDDFVIHCEAVWILTHNPPPAGFNRKDWTIQQKEYFEKMRNLIDYPHDYAEALHNITGQ